MYAIQRGLALESSMLKRIGLLAGTILAAFALIGAMASPAAAQEQVGVFLAGEESEEAEAQPRVEAESYPLELVGKSTTAHVFGFGEIASYNCPSAEFLGDLSGATSELDLAPVYPFFSCKLSTGGATTISSNGCEYAVTVDNAGPPYVGEFGLDCPEGFSYELHNQTGCSIVIPEQAGLDAIDYKNVGAGSERAVQVEFDVSGMTYSIVGPFFCPKGKYEDGTYTGTMTLRGYSVE